LEGTGAELRGGDHDMIDRAATAEQTGDTLIAGDIRRDCDGVQLAGNRIQAVNVTGCNNDIGPFPLRQFGGRKTDTGRASDDNDFLACKHHDVSSISMFWQFCRDDRALASDRWRLSRGENSALTSTAISPVRIA